MKDNKLEEEKLISLLKEIILPTIERVYIEWILR
jgi:hypothetical protein